MKRYHPAALLTALLNNQPMGFWPPTVLVRDARRHGVRVEPLDVQRSGARCALEGGAVRLGLACVLGLGAAGAARVLEARAAGPFADLAEFCRRTRLPRRHVENLIDAGACDGWGVGRRRLRWQLGALRYAEGELELDSREDEVDPPPLGEAEAHALQQRLLGVSTAEHPLARWREALVARGYCSSADVASCEHGARARAVGTLVLAQQPPTAKGFMFLTLEDELGMLNVVVRPGLTASARAQLAGGGLVEVEGVVQREDGAVNLLALRLRRRGEA
jgi:error-prone DNA polymerase